MRMPHLISAAVAAMLVSAAPAARAESLTLYCAADEVWCQLMARGFEEETGITVDMSRKSSGEIYAQLKAEAENPKGDIWWAGTGDPHLQAAEEGLTEEYVSPMRDQLQPWAIKQAEASGNKTVGVYSGALGFGYNKDLLEKNGLPVPKCWADLIKPEYKGHIQVANPNSSGTAYTMLATMVQLFGEDKGFEYLKALHKNVNQYTKSGSAPIKAAGLGETTIGIVFMHDAVAQTVGRLPDRHRGAVRGHRLRDRLDVHHQGRPQPRRGQEILRLGAQGRGAVARPGGQFVPDAVEQGGQAVGQVARPVDDQADRLRLQEVRLERRTQAPAAEMGREVASLPQ